MSAAAERVPEHLALSAAVREDFIARFPAEAVAVLEDMDEDALAEEIAGVGLASRLTVLDRLPPARSSALFENLTGDDQAQVVAAAPTHLALSLTTGLSQERREELHERLPRSLGRELERLVDLPVGAAGRLMDRAVCTLNRDMTVASAIERVRSSPVRGVRSLYLLDSARRLDGRVEMQALALADGTDRVGAYAGSTPAVDVVAPRDEVVELLERHRTDSLPVVDSGNRLLGVVRYDRLFDAVGESFSADMQTMVGASADEQALSSPGFAVRQRLPWLQINLLTAFLASAVVALFEGLIAQFTALAVLLPVVAGQGGNAGAQALAVAVRGLALREIGSRDLPRLLTKELAAGIVNGLALAAVCGGGVYLWSGSIGLALVISLAMLIAMPMAGVAGALVPMLLTRLGQDPATASSIVLTTVTDVAGFLSFLGIALALSALL
ncbi:MAG: magnesium transporter [Gammaproteobacteria bacterium]|nr:magnesium transporter [Gammaproteobacteria bacterium]MDE0365229.1 magnesium transporter [Gammaproteobacteria bacterium]